MNIQERISTLEEKKAALEVTYTKEWPEVKKAEIAIKRLEDELEKAAAEAIGMLKAKYEAAQGHENSVRQMYVRQRGTTDQQTRDQIEMAAYTQRLETSKQYLNTLLQKQREVQIAQGDKGNEVSIENYSRVPRAPVGPARLRNVMIAFVLSLVAGIGLAFLLDFLDDTVKSLDDVDRYIHLPALALIPASRGGARLKGLPQAKPRTRGKHCPGNDRRCSIADCRVVPALANVAVAFVSGPTAEDDPGHVEPAVGRKDDYGHQYGVHAGADGR